MTNKKFVWIIGLVLLAMLPIANAFNWTSNAITVNNFQSNTSNQIFDSTGLNNGTALEVTYINSCLNISGVSSRCANFSEVKKSKINYSNNAAWAMNGVNWSYVLLYSVPINDLSSTFSRGNFGGSLDGAYFFGAHTNPQYIDYWGINNPITTRAPNNVFHMVVITHNTAGFESKIYFDGTLNTTKAMGGNTATDTTMQYVGCDANAPTTTCQDMKVGLFAVFKNRIITLAEVTELWNSGNFLNNIVQSVTPIAIVNQTYPATNQQFTTSSGLFFWATANVTINNLNTSLYIDGIQQSLTKLTVSGNDVLTNFTGYSLNNGTHTYYIQYSNYTTTVNSTTLTFLVNSLPKLNQTYPANNTQFNTNSMYFFTSANVTDSATNVTLFIDGVKNQSILIATGNNVLSNFTGFTLAAGTHTWYMQYQVLNATANTTTNTFFIDTVVPGISSTFINGSAHYRYNNITGRFNFTDETVIFAWNISIDNTQIAGATGLSVTYVDYNLSTNLSAFGEGKKTLRVRVADGHTAEKLSEEYSIDKGFFNDKLEFTTERNSIEIKKKDPSFSDEWSTKRETDRFTFAIEPNEKSDIQTFIVNTEKELYVLNRPDLPYKSWIVSGNNWLDFKIKNQDDFTISIEKLTSTSAEVTVGNIRNTNKIEFESIGELNVIQQNFTFYIFNASLTYTSPVLETNSNTFYLTVFKNTSDYNTSNIFSFVNTGSIANSVVLRNATHDIYSATYSPPVGAPNPSNLSWNFTAISSTYRIQASQVISPMLINNCSNTSFARALNLSVYDEANQTILANATINVALTIFSGNASQTVVFNTTFRNGLTYAVCINPNDASYNVSSIMQYYAPGYAVRSYYIINMLINNVTQYINLFDVPISLSSIIQVKTYEQETSLPISGAYVSLLRFYPETNSYQTVEIERSDSTGFSIFSLIPYNTFYRWVVNYNGAIVLTTNPATVYTGTTTLPVPLGSNQLQSLQYIGQVGTNVSCDQSTLTCNFIWADTNNLVQTAIFQVYRVSGFGKQLIYNQSTSSPTGSMFYTITENTTGRNYEAVGSIQTNNNLYVVGRANLLANSLYSGFGTTGTVIYSAMILVMVGGLLLIDIGPVGVVLGSWAGIVFGAVFGIVPLTWAAILSLLVIGGVMLFYSKS